MDPSDYALAMTARAVRLEAENAGLRTKLAAIMVAKAEAEAQVDRLMATIESMRSLAARLYIQVEQMEQSEILSQHVPSCLDAAWGGEARDGMA